jgi:hypothetical protein
MNAMVKKDPKGDYVIRSIRLPKTLDNDLEIEAANRNLSTNALICSVLSRFDYSDKRAEKFGLMLLPQETVKRIINEFEDDKIVSLATELGRSLARQRMLFWFKEVTLNSFYEYLYLLSVYERNFSFELSGETSGERIMTAHHGLGRKWSLWLKCFLGEALRSNFGIDPRGEYDDDIVILKFSVESTEVTTSDLRSSNQRESSIVS